jgi:hypothetical protein
MKKDDKHVLISGIFSAADAKEVLLHLINHKINFHGMKNFSAEERFGKKDTHSQQRTAELKVTRENIIRLIEKAAAENKQLKIDSSIKIELQK